jgi:hypothetical protein
MLLTFETLWREICRQAGDPTSGLRCRAGAFEFALQQRLRAAKGTYKRSVLIADYLIPISLANFRERWADGLIVPSGDVPNRYPLHKSESEGHDAALALLDRRAPKMLWQLHDMPRLIEGLADSIPELDLLQLDERLLELGRSSGDATKTLAGICSIARLGDESDAFDVSSRTASMARVMR